MKKSFYTLLMVSMLAMTSNPARAQAWERNTKVLTLGFGASRFYHIDDYYYGNSKKDHGWYSPMTGQFNFQGEFGIHKYVGLGFTTGFGGRAGWTHDYRGEINMPMGMLANFHFYQLIADKSSKNLHSDKLDIYAGASAGSGVAVAFYKNTESDINTRRMVPLAFGGLHAGIRYYFKPQVGVTAEAGWGGHLMNAGFVFKLMNHN